jgi:ABC-type multidrug transport system ATPase subunit
MNISSRGGSISTKVFTWEHLDYTVPVPGGTRRLLSDVFGYVRPGTLTALMGASGAGKFRYINDLLYSYITI